MNSSVIEKLQKSHQSVFFDRAVIFTLPIIPICIITEVVPILLSSEVRPLEITVNDQAKIVEIWLTNEQQQLPGLKDSLKPLFIEYKAKKYKTAVFNSGSGDLTENTTGLILRNKAL